MKRRILLLAGLLISLLAAYKSGAISAQAAAADTTNHFPGGNCTRFAADHRSDLLPIINAHSSDAGWNWDGGFWDDNFSTLYAEGVSEYLVDTTPEVGAAVTFDPGTTPQLYWAATKTWIPWPMDATHGHVGVVSAIGNADDIFVDDQNFDERGTIGTHQYTIVSGMRFIHTLLYSRQQFENRTGGPSSVTELETSTNFSVNYPIQNVYLKTESEFVLSLDGKPILSSQRPANQITLSKTIWWITPGVNHVVTIHYWRGNFADGHQDKAPEFLHTWWPNSIVQAAEADPPLQVSYAYNLTPSQAKVGDNLTIYVAASLGEVSNLIQKIDLRLDGQSVGSIAGNSGSIAIDTHSISVGDHTLSLVALVNGYDGEVNTETITLKLGGKGSSTTCAITNLDANPNSPQSVGTTINLTANAACSGASVRAIRLKVDGNVLSEIGSTSLSATWNTSSASAGDHTIVAEVAAQGDNNWSAPGTQSMTYHLNGAPVSTGNCAVMNLSINPGSPQAVGTAVGISAGGNCPAGVRAVRILVDGNSIYELGSTSASTTWNTGGYAAGSHTIRVEVAAQGDNSWSNPGVAQANYTLLAGPSPVATPTNTPAPAGCQPPPIEDLSFNPGSAPVGTTINVHAKATWNNCFRSMRLKIDGNVVYEQAGPEWTWGWNTSSYSAGNHTVRLEVVAQGDNDWLNPAVQETSYSLLAPVATTAAPCTAPPIEDLSFNPGSATVGTSVNIHAKATWNNCFRSMRLKIDGNVVYEQAGPEWTWGWNTSGYGASNHTVRLEVAALGDNSWSSPTTRDASYTLQAGATATPVPCSAPPIEDLSFNPGSATVGTTINVHAKATWNNCFRSMRLKIDGNVVYEQAGPEWTWGWNTSGYSASNHNVRLEVAALGDNNWSSPTTRDAGYSLQAGATATPVPCTAPPIEDLSFNPGSATVGSSVNVHAKATWNSCFRSMRLKIDGNVVYEQSSPEWTWGWNTGNYSSGNHAVRLEVAALGDNNWSSPTTRDTSYNLQAGATATPVPCTAPPIEDLSFNPGSATVGTTVNVHAKATWNNCFRSMRLKIDGNVVYEQSSPEWTWGWNTSGYSASNHTVRLEVAALGDNNWSSPTTRDANYSLSTSGPSKPSLSSPSNGALLPPGTDVTLQWNSVSGATQYLVEIWGGQYGGNHATPCGWQSDTSCHIGKLSPGNVLWHVKAKDSNGNESSWSDDWNFTPQ